MRNFLVTLPRHPLSLLGAAITTASVLAIVTLFALELAGLATGPYLGILAFLVLPAILVLGLLFIPLGLWRHRKLAARAAATGQPMPAFPVLDFNRERVRSLALTFFVLTLVNLVILAVVTYKGVHVMESTQFCGQACHSVMQPEATSHRLSAHSNVACATCHVGPGASSFVEAKLSGVRQVFGVMLDNHPRPVPTPIHNLKPADEICTQCHAAAQAGGEKLKVFTHYQDDEASTATQTVAVLRLGRPEAGLTRGIHWHADSKVRIRFQTDPQRETIGDVEVTRADGTVEVFQRPEPAPEATEWRTMDCLDCHNRPAHTFATAASEVDQAMERGAIDVSLPFVKREGMAAVTAAYSSHDEAAAKIRESIAGFYASNYPDRTAELEPTVTALTAIYQANVFPSMKVEWGTYPIHLGHEDYPGCYRCHDEEHATAEGTTISQDCALCHALPAVAEEDPEILKALAP